MLNRKLAAAFFTAAICYFIVPLFFYDFQNGYFIIGFAVSIVAVPILFVVGILFSILIEMISKNKNILFLYIKHLICGLICVVVLLLLTEWDMLFVYTLIAFTYVSVFFMNDWIIKIKFSD
ncbi:hypothetical protein [Metasolibacillus meyeri]|uniref:hypothetical protein n=1 Tax=Metasolibacillus meyeri TaxID=1071052 RepID=UPI000D31C316|nr:hypothetical protein [Metasolibacillus meyeri]